MMTLTIELTPETEARLKQEAERKGEPPADVARRLIENGLPSLAPSPQYEYTKALFEQWAKEDATDDPEEIAAAEHELAEFKARINSYRTETGERPIYL
jgi:predicted transcriptional regulator